MQNKYPAWVAGIVGALVIIGIVIVLIKASPRAGQAPIENNSQNTTDKTRAGDKSASASTAADSLGGTLKASDAPANGNLMLVMPDRTVYLRTSRDYSALLDKRVKVQIKGNLESFQLEDIVAE